MVVGDVARLSARLAEVQSTLARLQREVGAISEALQELAEEASPSASAPAADTSAGSAPARLRYYVVAVGRSHVPCGVYDHVPPGVVGIYTSYARYALQVCSDASYPHTGRGSISFATGSVSQGFSRLSEAESYWKEQFGEGVSVIRQF